MQKFTRANKAPTLNTSSANVKLEGMARPMTGKIVDTSSGNIRTRMIQNSIRTNVPATA
jgi:hypothetical protein